MEANLVIGKDSRQVPFYGSYASFVRALKAMKEHGMPKRISPRTLTPLIGDEAPRTITHFIAMGWVDEAGSASSALVDLVQSYGEESWSSTLSRIIRSHYPFVPFDKLGEMTQNELHAAFVQFTGREAKVLKSAETFFLALAHESGIDLAERLYLRAIRSINEVRRLRSGDDEDVDDGDGERNHLEAEKPVQKKKDTSSASVSADTLTSIKALTDMLANDELTVEQRRSLGFAISVLFERVTK